MSKILICGASAFVAKGFAEVLQTRGYEVELFSRGGETPVREGNHIRGRYCQIDKNPLLADQYDFVVNFALLKSEPVSANVAYMEALVEMCQSHGVKKLIHFSSIMVYPYHLPVVDEDSESESSVSTRKRGYATIKMATDEYLESRRAGVPFEVVMVRPGFVLAPGMRPPYIKPLPMGFTMLKGDRRSKQPVVRREAIHEALVSILKREHNLPVYLLIPDNDTTKYETASALGYHKILTLPRWLFERVPRCLMQWHLMPPSLYSRFEGMYIYSHYSSARTEAALGVRF